MQSSLPRTFSALADPTRLAIVARLTAGEATVNELALPFSMSQPAISRHIRVLEEAGIILRRIDGPRRPCRLAPEALAPAESWLGQMRRALQANYARLDAVLDTMDTPQAKDTP